MNRWSIRSLKTEMTFLRIYLLVGLLGHKFVWEFLKRSSPHKTTGPARKRSLFLTAVKGVKITILLLIIVQTLMPDILPIATDSTLIRSAGVALFTAGLLIAVLSRIHLGNNWSDIESGQVLGEQAVVSKGVYGYVRHPIYVGDLLLLLGLELSLNSWLVAVAALLVPIVLWKAVREEKMLINDLPGYRLYCAQTKRFIPFIV
jgi:protein-S-isoprenylcysteine O-methyltransferase Ste14